MAKKVFTDESLATFVDEIKAYTDDIASTKANSSHNHSITANASDDDIVVLTGTSGTNAVTYSASHANSGVTAGTYKSVTVNAKGHVTAGSNPTTLSGYGITDAVSKTTFDTHASDTTKHITSTERTNWNAAKTHADSAHAPSNAEKNQNAFSNITVGSTTVAADTATDTVTFVGSNVTITPDATNDKITFAVADGSTSAKGIVQLTNSTSSTSTTTAATPSSVKSAYDLANTAKTNAATAQTRADSAYTLAESKVDSLSDLGITATATELNYMDGVTSSIQTQLDALDSGLDTLTTTVNGKANSSHEHSASKITSGILSIERGGTGNSSGYVQIGAVSGSTIGALATAEGRNTTASGNYSHAEGNYTEATGSSSHAEGQNTTASGVASHAEGENSTASGSYSHAEGENTIASSKNQHVQGKFNKGDSSGIYAHIVGNGESSSARSNAHTIDWDGNGWFAGNVYVGGTSQDEGSKLLTYDDLGWNLIYDSGEISDIANSIAGINVSGYTKFRIVVRCYNDGDSYGDRSGSAIFKAQNGKSYQFPVWTNMFSKSICTVSAMADFELTDDWLACPHASKLIGDIDIFTETEGGTAGNLTHTGSGVMKCTSPLSTLTISNLDQNSKYYFGMGSRVMVWGCK